MSSEEYIKQLEAAVKDAAIILKYLHDSTSRQICEFASKIPNAK